jgi:beta-lactam-binding protein with PASTA domain
MLFSSRIRAQPVPTIVVACLAAAALAGCGGVAGASEGVPDVRGLSLPDAKKQLESAGFSASVKSDGLLGVVVEEHWTVCDQDGPKGNLVPVNVSKQC